MRLGWDKVGEQREKISGQFTEFSLLSSLKHSLNWKLEILFVNLCGKNTCINSEQLLLITLSLI